ncbi:MAG: dihydrofolate reductase [Alphaproteobacteria bacterium]
MTSADQPSGRAEIALILARATNGVIGKQNGLPWRLAGDMAHFREITMGKPIVMGRKTFQSIGKPLPGRDNIVITRDADFNADGVHVAHDLAEALRLGEDFCQSRGCDQILVIGGAQVYRLALPLATRIYLTQVHMEAKGDVRLGEFSSHEWVETDRRERACEPGDSAAYSLVTLVRAKAGANS